MSEVWRSFWAVLLGSFFMAAGAYVIAGELGVSGAHAAGVALGVFIAAIGAGMWRQA